MVTNAQRHTAYQRLYHKAVRAKDHRNADRYHRIAMKYLEATMREEQGEREHVGVRPFRSRKAGQTRYMVRLPNGDWLRTKTGRRRTFAHSYQADEALACFKAQQSTT